MMADDNRIDPCGRGPVSGGHRGYMARFSARIHAKTRRIAYAFIIRLMHYRGLDCNPSREYNTARASEMGLVGHIKRASEFKDYGNQ